MTEAELQLLLEQSRRNNLTNNLTGMLLYLEGRLFDKWRMEFRLIPAEQTQNIPGFFNVTSGFLDEHITTKKHDVLNFIRSFYTINN